MKTPLVIAMSGLLLVGGSAARQTGTKGREASVAADAARQAQESLLKAQLAAWRKIRAEDWTEAQQKKKEYDQYVRDHPSTTPIDLIPTRIIDRSAAEAQQATGRVEMADRIIKDVEQRLARLGPAAARQSNLTPREAAVATLAEKEVEGELLSAQQAAWQPIRADEWEVELRMKRVYKEYARQHPDFPVDRSGAEANLAVGRVEALDRFLAATTRRLAALESEIKVARAVLTVPAGPGRPCFARVSWTVEGRGQVVKGGGVAVTSEIVESGGLVDVQIPLQVTGDQIKGTKLVGNSLEHSTQEVTLSGRLAGDGSRIEQLVIASRTTVDETNGTERFVFRHEWGFTVTELPAGAPRKTARDRESQFFTQRPGESAPATGVRYHYTYERFQNGQSRGIAVEKTLVDLESLSIRVYLDPNVIRQ